MKAEIVGSRSASSRASPHMSRWTTTTPGAPEQLIVQKVLEALKPFSRTPSVAKSAITSSTTPTCSQNHGIKLAGMRYDTMLESYVWNSVGTRHDMDSAAACYLGIKTITFEDVAGKGAKQLTSIRCRSTRRRNTRPKTPMSPLRLHKELWPKTRTPFRALEHLYQEIEQPLVPVLSAWSTAGAGRSRAAGKQSREIAAQLQDLRAQAHTRGGRRVQRRLARSSCSRFCSRSCGLPVMRKTPTGQPSTAEDVLEELAALMRCRASSWITAALAKLKSTYTDKLPEQINAAYRPHPYLLSPGGGATGRLSSSDPNLQNIPIRRPEGRRIRQAFVAPAGHVLLAADYSQIELRIMAHLSGDAGLLAAFAEDRDVHQATAAEVFGVPLER